MKNIEKHVKKQIQSRKQEAGGDKMRAHAVSDPRFSIVKSKEMFPCKKEEPHKAKEKETENPSKDVKRLKKIKGAEGKE